MRAYLSSYLNILNIIMLPQDKKRGKESEGIAASPNSYNLQQHWSLGKPIQSEMMVLH